MIETVHFLARHGYWLLVGAVPVQSTNLAKPPQETFGWPNAPHHPKRSAAAERKDSPRANRKNTELKPANLSTGGPINRTVNS